MDRKRRMEGLFRLRQGTLFVLVVVLCLISLSESPMEPEISDFNWSFIGLFLAMIVTFVYLLNESVGPNHGDDEKNEPR